LKNFNIFPQAPNSYTTYARIQGSIQRFVSGGSTKLSGEEDERVAGGHESRHEAPSGGEVWGGGVPLPSMGVRGCYPRENFET